MEYRISDVSKFNLKPYYWQDKGDFFETITIQSGATVYATGLLIMTCTACLRNTH
jgi:hypothetical protein